VEHAVQARALTKSYGSVQALDGLDLEVPKGGVFGLLGPNGAGKSTFLRLLMGLVRPSSGNISMLGEPLGERTLRRVGGFIESPRFHPFLTGAETLNSLALTAGAGLRAGELLELVDLTEAGGIRVDAYSLGMKQRLGIACAMIGDPELIVLDEPLNGLDPAGIREMRRLIRSLGEREGVTVLVSSHLLDEVERVCDHIAILDRGRLVRHGSVRELLGGQALLRIRATPLARAIEIAGADSVRDGDSLLVPATEAETPALLAALCSAGVSLFEASWDRPTLENLFLRETAR
jgi:ABC-2 type transport system ATP-binding protein